MSEAGEVIIKRILENQEIMLLALSKLILPKVCEMKLAHLENNLIDCYHETRRILGKKYIDRYDGI